MVEKKISSPRTSFSDSVTGSARATARSRNCQVWSQVARRLLMAQFTVCVANTTSMANRSKMLVKRLRFATQWTGTAASRAPQAHVRTTGGPDRLELAGIEMPPTTVAGEDVKRKAHVKIELMFQAQPPLLRHRTY